MQIVGLKPNRILGPIQEDCLSACNMPHDLQDR